MKKKLAGIIAAAVLGITALVGCGGSESGTSSSAAAVSQSSAASSKETLEADSVSTESSSEEELPGAGKSITALFFSLEGEYFTMIDDKLREEFTAMGYSYESQSSNFDAVTQIEQIENAAAKKTTAIWIWALDGRQVSDALKAARDQGVIVYSFVQDPGEGAADMVRGTDETICGTTLAEMAIEWADKEYGEDAPAGSIKTVFLANENSENQKIRCDTAEGVLKEDPRFDLIERVLGDGSTVKAQEITENMFTKYNGDIDCFLGSGGEDALGICAYLTSESCILEDPASVGVIAVEIEPALAEYMKNGYYDAAAINGGNILQNLETQIEQVNGLIHGEIEGGFSAVDIGRCTIDNLADYGY